jgi:predicted ester cyclase
MITAGNTCARCQRRSIMEAQANTVTRPAWGQETIIWLRVVILTRGSAQRLAGRQRKERAMSTERQVMQDYIDALVKRADFTRYFTEDVIATFEGTDQRADGREAAGQLIRYVHENAFDARPELKNLLVDTGKAAIEADFAGTHTGEFAGIHPTGRAVQVPYSVIYDLREGKISALRIYFPMSLLIEQLTS